MLEERNRDYNNTIHLLRNKLDVQDQYKYTSTSAIENHQKTRVQGYYIHHDVDTQFKQLQDQLLTKIEWLNSEFQHRMSTHELVMKHQLEMNELKFKMHLMEQQYEHRNISCQHDPYHRNICTPNVHFPSHPQPHLIRIYNKLCLYNTQHQECIVHLYLIQEMSNNTLRYLVIHH
jgi:hypothetical protein